MFVFSVAAFLVLVLGIAWKFQKEAVEAIPVGVCIMTLFLYVLAFFRKLSWCDYFAMAFLAGVLWMLLRSEPEKSRRIGHFVRRSLFSPAMLTTAGMLIVVTLCVRGKLTSWWDDYNFWATDLKSIYYLEGFAGKYQNVAPEFGDYPPGTQMMKWWFTHFSPHHFREGLMFAGYYAMNLAFLVPFLRFIPGGENRRNEGQGVAGRIRAVLFMAAGFAVLWLFPAVAEAFWLDGCCADLTMALIYGAFLASVLDSPKQDDRDSLLFYYGRAALFLAVLVLCKNTGFIWAAFGLIFAWGYRLLILREKNWRGLLAMVAAPMLTEGSWLGFCLRNRRVARLTGTALHMMTGSIHIPDYQSELVHTYLEAFIRWPLHRGKTPALDLSPLTLYILILVFVMVLYLFRFQDKKRTVFFACFLAVSGIVFYGINLICHLTIFATETQYLDPFSMVSSIERYGAPFTIGALYLLACLYLEGMRQSAKEGFGLLFCAAFVLLTTDYAGAWRALWGYRDEVAKIREERAEIIDDAAEVFLGQLEAGRVLYLRDSGDVSWVRNTYISFEASPVSVMYGNVDAEKLSGEEIVRAVREAHAKYLYVDELAFDRSELWSQFLPSGESFAECCLYQVIGEGTDLKLLRYEPNAES